MGRKTNYTHFTHRARIIGIRKDTKGQDSWVELRRVGKWWETKKGRRFDSVGNPRGYAQYPQMKGRWQWRLDVETIKEIGSVGR